MIDRRSLLRGGLSAGALALVPRRLRAQENPWGAMLASYSNVRPATFALPMPIPMALPPVRTDGDADVFELAVKPGTTRSLAGAATPILGFGGQWPGPTLLALRGRTVRVRVRNELDEHVSIHNHGHQASSESDGHPLDYVRQGRVKEYVYPNRQSGGTYWYHDHAMGLTGPHVYRGLAGFYIIHDPAEDALGLPAGEFDVPIALQDRIFDAENRLSYTVDAGTIFTGFLGNTLCANGVHAPHFEVAARKYRFRFLNGSNARNLRLALGGGDPLVQIASDGALLAAPVARTAIDLAPSERCDCIIDFKRYQVGTSVLLRNLDPTWPDLPDVLRFDVKRAASDSSRIPDRLGTIVRLDGEKVQATRRIRFELADGKWTLNGLRYDPERIDFRPRLGTVELWELKNAEQTQMHPFHQHLVPFQVLDVNGAPPPLELRGWKDTVAVPPSATVRILMRFAGTPGIYVFHCHKLEHEDHAMMLQQEVIA